MKTLHAASVTTIKLLKLKLLFQENRTPIDQIAVLLPRESNRDEQDSEPDEELENVDDSSGCHKIEVELAEQ